MTVGKPIAAGEVLSKSVSILTQNPVLLLPQVIALIPGLLNILISGAKSPLYALALIVDMVSVVVALIVSGAYPTMVKAVVEGGQFSISGAMGKAWHKFWTLLVASFLVALVVVLGFIALIVPGIILLTWYAYTIPAIMLEDKGATAGMAASKAFGRDKKWSTFEMFLAMGVVAFVVFLIQALISYAGAPLLGQVVQQLLFVPLGAWASVIFAYTYISYGPSSVGVAAGVAAPGMVPPASAQQPSTQTGAPVPRFCSACGLPLEPGSRFCRYCGKAV
jgi:hypothetical protein